MSDKEVKEWLRENFFSQVFEYSDPVTEAMLMALITIQAAAIFLPNTTRPEPIIIVQNMAIRILALP